MNELTETEARALVAQVNDHAWAMGRLLLELKEREGWRILGYRTWTDCLQNEFAFSRQYLYELMTAAPVQERLSTLAYKLNTAQAAALAAFPDYLQVAIVKATAANYDGKLTESRLRRVGEVFTEAVSSGHVSTGDGDKMTPIDAALDLEDEMAAAARRERLAPRTYVVKGQIAGIWRTGSQTFVGYPISSEYLNRPLRISVWSEQ
jgi:hypothetical protein